MNPVQKISKSRKRNRRSHHALRAPTLVRCAQCGNAKLPHCACGNCGYHNAEVSVAVAAGDEKSE
jgi:large subunit ribosomal protein L32